MSTAIYPSSPRRDLQGGVLWTALGSVIAVLSWGLWVPLTHVFTFAPGAGWVRFLPQFGFGAIGGWWVSVAYVVALGTALWLRWQSGAWRRVQL